jgi:hypothetical protein
MASLTSGVIVTDSSLYSFEFSENTDSFLLKNLKTHSGYNFTEIIAIKNHGYYLLYNKNDSLLYTLPFGHSSPKNSHFMMNFPLKTSKSLKISPCQNFLAYPMLTNKLKILHKLDPKPRAYGAIDLPQDQKIKDFLFIESQKLAILTEAGFIYIQEISRRNSKEIFKLDLFEHLSDTDQMNPNLKVGRLAICAKRKTLIVSTEIVKKSKKSCSNNLMVFRLNEDKTMLQYGYSVETGLDRVPGSGFVEMIFDYYIGDYPILFVFPKESPKVMMVYILYDGNGKKICTIDTLHGGDVLGVDVTDFHLVSVCNGGFLNALQIV